jgi:RNA polymerase sigma-70 factor, ECF subfamily
MPGNKTGEDPVPSTVARISAGAPVDGLGPLLEQLRPDLLRFACWLARDRSLAEDIVQEAMLRAWRSQADLKDPAAARAWLLTIVRREHARLYERKRLEITSLDESQQLELRLAILRLPEAHRVPLVMQVIGGFTTGEIAREMNLTLPAVLTRLFRARNRLRELCGVARLEDGDDGGAPS